MSREEKSLADLCLPLSAKVMPAAGMHSSGGKRMTDQQALMAARMTVRQGKAAGKGRAKGDQRHG